MNILKLIGRQSNKCYEQNIDYIISFKDLTIELKIIKSVFSFRAFAIIQKTPYIT